MSYKTTLLPDYISVVQNISIDYYNTTTTLLGAFGSYLSELQVNIDIEKSKSSYNSISTYAGILKTLNDSKFKMPQFDKTGASAGTKEFDDIFKLHFIESYHSLLSSYQNIVNKVITSNDYFVNFSDDIGIISDSACVLDNNTSPYFDIYQNNYFLINSVPVTILSKITKAEKSILKMFSYYGDTSIRLALSGLQSSVNASTATTAHGQNLVTDIKYYDRAVYNQLSIMGDINLILGNISEFVMFFKQLNPKDLDPERRAIFYKYTVTNMENIQKSVDIFKNDISTIEKSTFELLG